MFEDEGKRVSRALVGILVLLVLFAGVSAGGVTLFQWARGGFDQDVQNAAKLAPQEFKGPMLEQREGEVLARVRAAENELLQKTEWVDRAQGTARVPIELAMQMYAETATAGGAR